jgi:uncharacterized protein
VRIWIDLANSPHVPLFGALTTALEERGDVIMLTARDHAQTVELARERWGDLEVIGGASPPGRVAKVAAMARRIERLARFARRERPDIALSHGSYAQVVAARLAGLPVVTMMDYEFQPANHLSFRLSSAVVVPSAFPAAATRRFGARRVVTYDGFKEELYLAGQRTDTGVLDAIGVDSKKVIAVFRTPPHGALYHRGGNERFEALLAEALAHPRVEVIVLPRTASQRQQYLSAGAVVPEHAIDGSSLLACADVVIGAGGTMSREAALLGTPTYTVFAGRLAAVDAALIALGRLHDLRAVSEGPVWAKRPGGAVGVVAARAAVVRTAVEIALEDASRRLTSPRSTRPVQVIGS